MKKHRAVTRCRTLAAVLSCLLFAPLVMARSGITGSDLASATLPEVTASITSDLMVLGPVESVDHKAGFFNVLGQTVRLSGSEGALRSLRRSLLLVSTGVVVEVRGRLLTTGQIEAASIAIGSRQNVFGAQPLFVRGLVGTIDSSTGRLSIGNLIVDYTGALHSLDALSIRPGSEFLATGIQPTEGGSLVAVAARGIAGSDLNGKGITGSDLTGIAGSDLNGKGITGSDLTGIAGSDF